MDPKKIVLEKINKIGVITFNDPENRNGITLPVVDELISCLDECEKDEGMLVVVIRGSGKVFSVGGNIKSMKKSIEAGTHRYGKVSNKIGTIFTKLRQLRKPVIASIHGAVAGGGLNVALGCDFRIATNDTKFVFAFVNLALVPDAGCVLPLVRAVGVPRVTELLLTGRTFSAVEALDWGLVNQVVLNDQLEEATMRFANKLAEGPTISYGMIKTMINRVAYTGLEMEIENAVEYQILCGRTEDHREAVAAFIEKREPIFKGR